MVERVFKLSHLNNTTGLKIKGIDASRAGGSVSSAGDVNGDGFQDILIGSDASNSSQAYLVYGNRTFSSSFELSSLDGTNGVIFEGTDGVSVVSSAGDTNGDGLSDILIGFPEYRDCKVYLIYGSKALSSPFDLSSLNGVNGVIFKPIPDSGYHISLGKSVSSAGDINGDGFQDILIGASGADPGTKMKYPGQVYLIYGSSALPSPFELSSLNGTNGVIFNGRRAEPQNHAGASLSSVGDINGDGIPDILIGASADDLSTFGHSYLVYGSKNLSSPFELSSLDGSNGVVFNGVSNPIFAFYSVSSVGDFNGDGIPDMLIGNYGARAYYERDQGRQQAGQVYLVYGSSMLPSPFDLVSLNGTNGVLFNGSRVIDRAGFSVSSAGDVNGDEFQDILIGAPGDNLEYAGRTYLVYGTSALPSPFELSNLDGSNGIIFKGKTHDVAGVSVASVVDFNGDGGQDILIGASLANPGNDKSAGEVYVVYADALV